MPFCQILLKIIPYYCINYVNNLHLGRNMSNTPIGITRFDGADAAAGGTPRPFAKAVRAGNFIYVSGQVPTVEGEVVSGGIIAQTEAVMENIISVLSLADCGLEHVVKVSVWLDDTRDFSSFNSVFAKYFTAHPPARSTVQSAIMVDAKVEMDVVAYKPE
jgi:reactive intermediate/imine deaminase